MICSGPLRDLVVPSLVPRGFQQTLLESIPKQTINWRQNGAGLWPVLVKLLSTGLEACARNYLKTCANGVISNRQAQASRPVLICNFIIKAVSLYKQLPVTDFHNMQFLYGFYNHKMFPWFFVSNMH